ncbi:hypothetical protein BKA67DRAFT_113938 [Truncatella angustata]|uniref:Uncharacterized protein n=1 Tax=Truncatella angustata TaxID=152316 RepID=A0A9P8RGD3_9PEZI|nr:uncharacterized protein BKA67DRAFT_113938 [Truncatella angustata]KAH6645503.1 hypothetical protein BKA67DRAFT_113938 [Truncatella angustata]
MFQNQGVKIEHILTVLRHYDTFRPLSTHTLESIAKQTWYSSRNSSRATVTSTLSQEAREKGSLREVSQLPTSRTPL